MSGISPVGPSVGGFVTVISNRDIGFRFSVYSDVLVDWPLSLSEFSDLELTDKIDLVGTNENDRFSVSQISPGYYNLNVVAFYLLKGQLLVVLLGCSGGSPGQCLVFPGIEPQAVAGVLDDKLGFIPIPFIPAQLFAI